MPHPASLVIAGAVLAMAWGPRELPAGPPAGGSQAGQAAAAPEAGKEPPEAAAPDADYGKRVDSMLSAALLADLYQLARDPDVSDEGYQASLAMALRCARLAPGRRAAWDLTLLLADQAEIGAPDAARAARREALSALSALDPADDAVRLARIADMVESHPTADARVRAYETVLAPRNREATGAPCASRLAYQLASLESRIGNPELFARWLADSVKTDPSYPTAAQAAAGFFRMRVSDPAADVELLSGAVEANPRDIATWSALVNVLLDGAAFEGAERVIRMAIAVAEAERRSETVYSLTGDLATALWGRGQADAAARELSLRMSRLTDDYRRIISLIDPTITTERLAREFPPVPNTFAIAMLGLAQRRGDRAEVARLVEQSIRGSDAEIRRARDGGASDRRIAEFDIQKLAITLLFAPDPSAARGLIDSTARAGALGEDGRRRFEAMLDWREGRLDRALAELEPSRGTDPLAGYAHACALIDSKRVPEAAAEFRAIAQAHVGTSIGLLALDRLASALGQQSIATAQLSTEIAARSAAMEQSLKRHLPAAVDALVDAPLRALTVDVEPSATTVRPYEPLDLRIRIRNNSRLPMAVGADAPVSGTVTLRATAPRAGEQRMRELPPHSILVDRRLRLEPGQEIDTTVETALTPLGLLLAFEPLDAHLVNVAVVSNPASASGGGSPGFMGTVTEAAPIQFTGVQVTEAWIAQTRAAIKVPGRIDSLVRLALLAHAIANPDRFPEPLRPLLAAATEDAIAAWKALPERAQAWIVAILPRSTPGIAPLLEAARSTTSPDVLRSWVVTRISDPKDALLDVCRRSGDAELANLADATAWTLQRRAARAINEVSDEAERAKAATTVPQGGGR